MDDNETILNFEAYRNQKQLQGEDSARQLYKRAMDFTDRNANIREKVRGKHLFRRMTGLSGETPLTPPLEEVFSEWFLFDYKTIQGFTMFSLFIKKSSQQLTEPELILGALFLSTVLEPVVVAGTDNHKGQLTVKSRLSDQQVIISSETVDVLNLKKGELVFLRRLPLVAKDILLGNIYPVSHLNAISDMDQDFNEQIELTWRAFLKRYAYSYLVQASHLLRPE